ncbi:hypothetical protein F5Y00DRAFT_261858 [Daldinia vernicosa]|uniref:uncharacterized protein n=1 Tax=Daldinia vernicosa TaxID=114800 RepID=UPI002008565E|nr:uncharacterized protein F5Y00DRAFT_261858 [Daldinia vernicosa]KAI0849044.1 hypothetical protein F5Y00DRAFT_261858 [Daldinia vernicosa]
MAEKNKKPEEAWLETEEEDALFPSPGESPLFDGPETLKPWEIHELKVAEKVEAIVQDDSLDEPAKIDAIAEVRNWFNGPTEIIDAFLTGDIDIGTAVDRLAAPIEKAYSTADYGRAYYYAEMTARSQRQNKSPEKALESWGPEEDWPKPSPPADETYETDEDNTEGHLWSLWYGILHAAKRIPWTDTIGQERLLALVEALKLRPDPPLPSPMTIPLKRDWIWADGTVWSTLSMLRPSAREVWNNSPGYGAGWSLPEQHAWISVNAFMARLVASGTGGGFAVYGDWAVSEALERVPRSEGLHVKAPAVTQATLRITAACVWLQIAGRYMWNLRTDEGVPPDLRVADLGARENKLPWYGQKKGAEEAKRCTVRWDFWRRRLEQEGENEELPGEVRELARGSAEMIGKFLEGY